MRKEQYLTLAPLLGPMGGGLGLGASPSAGGASAAGGGGAAAAASSEALTTSLELLVLEGKLNMELLEAEDELPPATEGAITNPEAADAMLHVAMKDD